MEHPLYSRGASVTVLDGSARFARRPGQFVVEEFNASLDLLSIGRHFARQVHSLSEWHRAPQE
jgi:hypothetical protein